jgi:cytochrome c oxidase subunit 1
MAQFRVCPDSGFYFDKSAESLMKANAVAGAVSLLIAGILALGVILTRWQEVHLLPADLFYQALTGHGINALIFWIIFFEMAILYFASSTLLRTRLAAPRWAWLGFALMIIGMVMNNVAVLRGGSSVMMTSYAPMQAEPSFYLGLILFAVGALIGCFVFLGTLVIAREDRTYEGSIPLVTFGALTACIIAIFTIASGAIILVPTWLWSIGYIGHIDAAMYRVIWWGMGHDVGKGQPHGFPALHLLPATGERASHSRRPGHQFRVESVQHQLRDVPGGAGEYDPRPYRTGLDGSRAARQGLYQGHVRVVTQGALG